MTLSEIKENLGRAWSSVVVILFVVYVTIHFREKFTDDVFYGGVNGWVYTDWLIDYSAGFTRRGLSGEVIDFASKFVHPIKFIGALSWFLFITVAWAFVRLLCRSLDHLGPSLIASALFLPTLLPFYLKDHRAFGRKEMIGSLILLWHLHAIKDLIKGSDSDSGAEREPTRRYLRRLTWITAILLPAHIFMHEGSLFLFLPVHMMLSFSILRIETLSTVGKRLRNLAIWYSPVALAFLVVALEGRPTFEVAQAMCQKWERLNALIPGACDAVNGESMWALPATFSTLPWTVSQASSLIMNITIEQIVLWLFVFALTGFMTVQAGLRIAGSIIQNVSRAPSVSNATHSISWSLATRFFAIPWLFSVPLYILGCDAGRWHAVTCLNFIMIMLSRELMMAELRVFELNRACPGPAVENAGEKPTIPLFQVCWLPLLMVAAVIRIPIFEIGPYEILSSPFKDWLRGVVDLF